MILVAGATGQLGGLITRRLLAEGREVRILVRPGSDYAALVEAGAVPVLGDLKEPSSLEPAVAGIDTVITTANSARRGGDDTPKTVDLEGNASLIDAAQRAGVRRFVYFNGLGGRADSPDPFMAAKAATEDRLRASGLDFTIIASTPFIDVWVGMVVLAPILEGREVAYAGDGQRRYSMIAVEDVAAFATAAIDHPDASRSYVAIGGPQAFTWRDAVAAFERALGRPISQRGVAVGQPVPGIPDQVQGLITYLGTTDMELDAAETADRFGVQLTSLDAWVQQVAAAARSAGKATGAPA